MALPERRSTILTFIVDDYISTAMPVSSNAVANSGGFNVSSATIRNEMGVLIDEGYLLRPHPSSGAVPSEKGYRHFVGELDKSSQPPDNLVTLLQHQTEVEPDDVDAWVQVTASVIADLIGALAVHHRATCANAQRQADRAPETARYVDYARARIAGGEGLQTTHRA